MMMVMRLMMMTFESDGGVVNENVNLAITASDGTSKGTNTIIIIDVKVDIVGVDTEFALCLAA